MIWKRIRQMAVGLGGGDERALGNFAWLMGERALSLSGLLLLLMAIARSLGDDAFGIYQYGYALVFLIFSLSQLGLGNIMVRELVSKDTDEGALLGTMGFLRVASATGAALLIYPIVLLLRPGDEVVLLVCLCFSGAAWFQISDVFDWWFQSRLESRYVAIAKAGGFFVSAFVKIYLLLAEAGVVALAAASVVEFFLAFLGMAIFYWRRRSVKKLEFDFNLAWRLIKEAFPLLLASAAAAIYHRIDQVMIGEMRGMSEVGWYSSAVIIAEAAFIIPMLLSNSYFPAIIRASAASDEALHDVMLGLYRVGARLGYLFAIPVSLGAPVLIEVVFGAEFSQGAESLRWLAWTGILVFLGSLRGRWLIARGHSIFYLCSISAGCLLNIILNLIWIPRFGGAGAAMASIVSYWVAAHGSLFFYAPVRKDAYRMLRAVSLYDDVLYLIRCGKAVK